MADEELNNENAEMSDSKPEIPNEENAENAPGSDEPETPKGEDKQDISEPSMADVESSAPATDEAETEQPEDQDVSESPVSDDESTEQQTEESSEDAADQGMNLSEEEMAMISELGGQQSTETPDGEEESVDKISSMEFEQFSKSGDTGESHNIDMLLDVTMPISIELGRTSMPIQDILNLGPGSVVELNKLAGEPVDLLVNEKLIAKGEVVVVDENFGIRITSMTSKEDRIKSLG
ncbi:MAG: flagellar motor switch protein FliN [candidate division Zixibacteria bacterium]